MASPASVCTGVRADLVDELLIGFEFFFSSMNSISISVSVFAFGRILFQTMDSDGFGVRFPDCRDVLLDHFGQQFVWQSGDEKHSLEHGLIVVESLIVQPSAVVNGSERGVSRDVDDLFFHQCCHSGP